MSEILIENSAISQKIRKWATNKQLKYEMFEHILGYVGLSKDKPIMDGASPIETTSCCYLFWGSKINYWKFTQKSWNKVEFITYT